MASDKDQENGSESASTAGEEPTSSSGPQTEDAVAGCLLPIARIKSIVGSVPGAVAPAPDGLFAYAKAAELFIEDLLKSVESKTGAEVGYDELADYINETEELEWLQDFFPKRITLEEARQRVRQQD